MPPTAPKWASIKPAPIKTWVRIRPLAAEGEKGGHGKGEAVEKELGSFDENAVKIINHDQRGKDTSYDYPSKVFPVDCTQEAVGAEVLPGLLDDFWSERSVMIFACIHAVAQTQDTRHDADLSIEPSRGQTGRRAPAKRPRVRATPSILQPLEEPSRCLFAAVWPAAHPETDGSRLASAVFGFPESLASECEDAGWGLLPRAVHATLAHNAEQATAGVHSVLLLSAVEFAARAHTEPRSRCGRCPMPTERMALCALQVLRFHGLRPCRHRGEADVHDEGPHGDRQLVHAVRLARHPQGFHRARLRQP
jgi:hypothetical protein